MMSILGEMLTNDLPLLHHEHIKNLNIYQLFCKANILAYPSSGIPIYTPYGLKIFQKLEHLLRKIAKKYGFTELLLSVLQSRDLFHKSGRYDIFKEDILSTLEKKNYILSPTSEEQIASFLSTRIRSYRALPLHLYQIRQFFRNNNAHGVTRNKEFIVFDSYSLHASKESLREAFLLYDSFFKEVLSQLNIIFFINTKSEERNYIEYLFLTQDGEYKLPKKLLIEQLPNYNGKISKASSICMGMIVDPIVSQSFNFKVDKTPTHSEKVYIGAFGFGLIRALTAIIEQQRDDKGINLPTCLQPYSAIFIPENNGDLSHHEKLLSFFEERGDIVIDDRKCGRNYKINYAFFIGVTKIIYTDTLPNYTKYHILHRSGKADECDNLEKLNQILD